MPGWYLLLALLFVVANGFFVAAEFALVKVRATQLAEMAAEGNVRAEMARRIARKLDSYLSATQLGVTLASLALGSVGEPVFAHLIEPRLVRFGVFSTPLSHSISASLAFVIISWLHIIFGELGPKYIAINKPLNVSLWLAYPLRGFYVVAFPVIWLLNRSSNTVLRLLRIKPAGKHEIAHSEEELRLILASSERAGVLSEPNLEMIEGVFQFSKRTARQIMVPRTDVVVLSTRKSIAENLEIIRTTSHTRYPLCDGTLDDTIGLIHVKDLFLAQLRGPGRPLNELRRDVLFVPETTTVEGVLRQFIEQKTHMAVVLDEYGGASGIVSLENITEELFGPIQDEFDRERQEIEELADGRFRVRGDYLIEDLADRLHADVGEPAEETIGGYVAAQLGGKTGPGMTLELGELHIEVVEAKGFRVRWVTVQKRKKTTVTDEEKQKEKE
jgi:CBS domain containing-hemolysin-like protein